MTTIAARPLAPPVAAGRHDRVFYGSVAAVLALTTIVGFGPTYYFNLLGSSPIATLTGGPVTVLVHGAFFGVSYLFVLAGGTYDFITRGRVHPVYIWGGAVLALSVPLRLMVSGTDGWIALAGWMVGLV